MENIITICIDYDSTYTTDPRLFDAFINMAKNNGHEVICCTMRYEHEAMEMPETIGRQCPIYFTGRKAKEPFLRAIGISPSIWIDDSPGWIFTDAITPYDEEN